MMVVVWAWFMLSRNPSMDLGASKTGISELVLLVVILGGKACTVISILMVCYCNEADDP